MNRQRGVMVFLIPLVLVTIVLLGTLAIDGARLYSLRQEMQSQVNAAATAAASEIQTCGGAAVSPAKIKAAAVAGAVEQGLPEDASLDVYYGLVSDADGDGDLDFQEVSSVEQSNGVLVRYTREEPISVLLPASVIGTVKLDVNAAVRKEAVATISAAGSTAVVSSGILGGLLGAVLREQPDEEQPYKLDPTDVESLQNTTVRLGALLEAARLDSVAALAGLDGYELAEALTEVSGLASPAVQIVDDLLGASGIRTIQVEDVLDIVGGSTVPETSEFPVYDTVISLVLNLAQLRQEANGGFIELPVDINITLPAGISSIDTNVKLNVGTPPKVVFGPARRNADGEWLTRFYSPDVNLQVSLHVELLRLGALLGGADVDIPLSINAGGAEGSFVASRCARGVGNDVDIFLDIDRSVVRLATGKINPFTGGISPNPAKIEVLNVLSVPLISSELIIEGRVDGTSSTMVKVAQDYSLYCDDEAGCSQASFTDPGSGVGDLQIDVHAENTRVLDFLPIPVDPIIDDVVDLLSPVLTGVLDSLVNPLLQALGVGLGGVTVTVTSVSQENIQLIEGVRFNGSQ